MTKSTRYLHGTLRDHEPSIRQHGLLPGRSQYTHDYYDEEDTEDTVFMAHEKDPKRAVSSIRGQIGKKLNKHPAKVNSQDIEKHGAMFVSRGDDYDTYHKTEDGYGKNSKGGYDHDPPSHSEMGDYYSRHDTSITGRLTGKRLVQFLRKRKLVETVLKLRTEDRDIKEAFYNEKAHKNPSIAAIKNITKTSKYHETRWAVHHDGTLWAGDAAKFNHDNLGDRGHGHESDNHHAGYVTYNPTTDKHYYTGWDQTKELPMPKSNHKIMDRFKKHGMIDAHSDNINESFRFLDKIHRNPPMETIKNIAKHSEHQHARISVDHDGTLWVAAAERFLHDQFGKEPRGNAKNQHTYGFVTHKKDGNFVYGARKREDNGTSKHPIFDKFHKAGIHHMNTKYEINEENLMENKDYVVKVGDHYAHHNGFSPNGKSQFKWETELEGAHLHTASEAKSLVKRAKANNPSSVIKVIHKNDLNESYEFTKNQHSSNKEHMYNFSDNMNRKYQVNIAHSHSDQAYVDFTDNNQSYKQTNDQKHKAVAIFSTVKNVIKHHKKEHPEIKNLTFSATGKRTALYDKITKRHGGRKVHSLGKTPYSDAKAYYNIPLQEDAPTVNVGGGAIAGVGVGPQGEPGRKAKLMPLARRRLDIMNQVKTKKSKE